MAYPDFRAFISALEAEGSLIRVGKPVSTRYEIAAYIRKSSDEGGPAFLFEHVQGFPSWKVVGGIYASPARIARALGCTWDDVPEAYEAAIEHPIDPVVVPEGSSQEEVRRGEEVDLTRLPIVTHSEKDAGPFITSGVDIAKDPDTGVRGLGIHRRQLHGPRLLGIQSGPARRVYRAFLKCEERDDPLDIAIAIGAGPYVDLASQARVPHGVDKLGIAGALQQRPVALVRCKTVDIEVPADAEVIIEGRLLPGVRKEEGPFGEVHGGYARKAPRPVMDVTAVTHRRGALYQTALTGMPTTENHLMHIPPLRERMVLRELRRVMPEVRDVAIKGRAVLVSIRKRLETEGRNVILATLGMITAGVQAKYCIVMDDDIDIRDPEMVFWAIFNRVQPDRDVLIFPTLVGAPLDPSAPLPRQSSKMGIDATKPLDAESIWYEAVRVPGTEDVRW